jgi:signal transduction histidine kinase
MEELSSVLDECFRRIEDLKLIDAKKEQLRIAQKMEAVGHLAGGIAHDFNNLNTVIIGNLAYLLNDLNEDALDAYKAAKRCSTLVEQLLAFSARKKLESMPPSANSIKCCDALSARMSS